MTARITATSAETEGDRLPPVRFAFDPHTWKEIVHLLTNLPMAFSTASNQIVFALRPNASR